MKYVTNIHWVWSFIYTSIYFILLLVWSSFFLLFNSSHNIHFRTNEAINSPPLSFEMAFCHSLKRKLFTCQVASVNSIALCMLLWKQFQNSDDFISGNKAFCQVERFVSLSVLELLEIVLIFPSPIKNECMDFRDYFPVTIMEKTPYEVSNCVGFLFVVVVSLFCFPLSEGTVVSVFLR